MIQRRAWRSGRRRGGEAGGTAVEFALVSPLLFVVLFGLLSVGTAFYCGAAVRNAVQRASRALIANPNTTAADIKTRAQAMLTYVPVQSLAITITQEAAGAATVKRVSWTYRYPLSIPLVPARTLVFDSSLVTPLAPS